LSVLNYHHETWWFSGVVNLAGTGDQLEAINMPLLEVGDQTQQEVADSGQ
jgi:hypothetical protein